MILILIGQALIRQQIQVNLCLFVQDVKMCLLGIKEEIWVLRVGAKKN